MKDATKRIEWLESMRELNKKIKKIKKIKKVKKVKKVKKDENLKLITLKIGPKLLKDFKAKCKLEKITYTLKIKELIKDYLNQ